MKRFILFGLVFALAVYLDSLGFYDSQPHVNFAFWNFLGGLASGLFGLGSSLVNSSSQSQTNAYNLQAQRETNEANQRINEANLAYNRESRDMAYQYQTDLYNKIYRDTSPVVQRQQFEQAGINPYFALGNITGSQATSSSVPNSSAPSAIPMQSPHMEAVQFDPSPVVDSINSYFNNQRLDADTQSRRIQNITQLDRDKAELQKTLSQKNLTDEQRKETISRINTLEAMRDIEVANAKRSGSFIEQQTENVKADTAVKKLNTRTVELTNAYQEWRNDYEKKYGSAELKRVDALTKEALAAGSASAASAVLAKAQERGVRIDNYQKNKLNWLIREEKKTQIQRNKFEMKYPTQANKAIKGISQMFEGEYYRPDWKPSNLRRVDMKWPDGSSHPVYLNP